MATFTNDDGELIEVVERYVSVTQPMNPSTGSVQNCVSVLIREDDAEEMAWLKAHGYTRRNTQDWRKVTKRADLGGEMATLLGRGYSVPGGQLFPGVHRQFTREAYGTALGRPAKSADFVFPNPLIS